MVDKLHEYEGVLGRIHGVRDSYKDQWSTWKEEHPGTWHEVLKKSVSNLFSSDPAEQTAGIEDYAHIYRRKTRKELIRVSAAVMGIEFSYAAETAFVSPTLLKIGVEHKHMTLVWALSPLVGFFLTPILGSMSDGCRLPMGRRRPFIILMSLGVLIGLLLVPNGEYFGYAAGDTPSTYNFTLTTVLSHRTSALGDVPANSTFSGELNETHTGSHSWGIFFTILGTVLLDFDADACQSPSRAYLLDVTVPEDHARGLSTFTIMAGLGGFFGYATGGINWDVTFIGTLLGGHVRAVFTLITIIFILCVTYTITSFKEVPLQILEHYGNYEFMNIPVDGKEPREEKPTAVLSRSEISYGAVRTQDDITDSTTEIQPKLEEDAGASHFADHHQEHRASISPPANASLSLYLKSIIFMPHSLRILCLTNLFCWMAHVCYSLYFTDFVGEAVFNGNPEGLEGSVSRQLYEEGIRFGCWGMSMYSLSCACYSFIIERLISRFRARPVYVGGLLVYSSGMLLMALTKHKVGVIVFSWTAGVMYSTLFTMPYLLVAHYHAKETFELTEEGNAMVGKQIRGLGTDIALVSSMVFLAQFILSICMGTIVTHAGTTTAVVSVASVLAFLGAISATQVMYLDL